MFGLGKTSEIALTPLGPFPDFPLGSLKAFPASLKPLLAYPSLANLGKYYLHAPPLHSALLAVAYNTLWTYVLGELTGNLSQVDRVWPILPVIYTAHFTFHPVISLYFLSSAASRPQTLQGIAKFALENVDPRSALMLATQLLWSFRLNFNAWRRGFFSMSEEDYRWPVLRKILPYWALKIFNLGFIAVYQNILLFAIATPAYYLMVQAHPQTYFLPKLAEKIAQALMTPPFLAWYDYTLAGLAVSAVAGEFISDNIQQAYQSFKHAPDGKRPKTKTWSLLPFGLGPKRFNITWDDEDRKRGFVSQGVWAYSRHPAFALEQTFWVLQAFAPVLPLIFSSTPGSFSLPRAVLSTFHRTGSVSATARELYDVVFVQGTFPYWVFYGALALIQLFMGSTIFTEYITSPKYPAYKQAYQKRVGFLWPIHTYIKRVWLSVTKGNDARRRIEKNLGWGEKKVASKKR